MIDKTVDLLDYMLDLLLSHLKDVKIKRFTYGTLIGYRMGKLSPEAVEGLFTHGDLWTLMYDLCLRWDGREDIHGPVDMVNDWFSVEESPYANC